MILTHHGINSFLDKVLIAGKFYKVVQIGNQVWLAENLNSIFDGIEFSTSSGVVSTPTCWYYNNENEGTTLLYNAYALPNIIVDGWRVPSSGDFMQLIEFVGGSDIAGKKLKTVDAGGTDEFDFSIDMTGYRKTDGTYTNVSTDITRFWSSTEITTENNVCYSFSKNEDKSQAVSISRTAGYAVRLVKDA